MIEGRWVLLSEVLGDHFPQLEARRNEALQERHRAALDGPRLDAVLAGFARVTLRGRVRMPQAPFTRIRQREWRDYALGILNSRGGVSRIIHIPSGITVYGVEIRQEK